MYSIPSQVALVVKNSLSMKDIQFSPWVGKLPWRKAWQCTLVVLPGTSHGQRSLEGYSPKVIKSWTPLKQLSEHACTYSS